MQSCAACNIPVIRLIADPGLVVERVAPGGGDRNVSSLPESPLRAANPVSCLRLLQRAGHAAALLRLGNWRALITWNILLSSWTRTFARQFALCSAISLLRTVLKVTFLRFYVL